MEFNIEEIPAPDGLWKTNYATSRDTFDMIVTSDYEQDIKRFLSAGIAWCHTRRGPALVIPALNSEGKPDVFRDTSSNRVKASGLAVRIITEPVGGFEPSTPVTVTTVSDDVERQREALKAEREELAAMKAQLEAMMNSHTNGQGAAQNGASTGSTAAAQTNQSSNPTIVNATGLEAMKAPYGRDDNGKPLAPYGYKKSGDPAKRPGRKAAGNTSKATRRNNGASNGRNNTQTKLAAQQDAEVDATVPEYEVVDADELLSLD